MKTLGDCRWWPGLRRLCVIAAAGRRRALNATAARRRLCSGRWSPVGETEVHYFNNGVMTHETRIPGDSMFNTSGRGSGGGGVPQPCFDYSWFVTEPNPNAVVDPVTLAVVDVVTGLPTTPDRSVEVRQPSTAWIFREVVPTGTWTPERQGLADATDLRAQRVGRV